MIKTMVVPTDCSFHVKKAIDLAADIAGKYDARLMILHVLLLHTSMSDIETLCKENAMPAALGKKFENIRKAFLKRVATSHEAVHMPIIVPGDLLNTRRGRFFVPELCPPVTEPLQRQPVKLAIFPLIQIATTPAVQMRPLEHFRFKTLGSRQSRRDRRPPSQI